MLQQNREDRKNERGIRVGVVGVLGLYIYSYKYFYFLFIVFIFGPFGLKPNHQMLKLKIAGLDIF